MNQTDPELEAIIRAGAAATGLETFVVRLVVSTVDGFGLFDRAAVRAFVAGLQAGERPRR